MGSEGSPAGAKAAVKALVGLLGRERAAAPAAKLADKLLKALKVSYQSAAGQSATVAVHAWRPTACPHSIGPPPPRCCV